MVDRDVLDELKAGEFAPAKTQDFRVRISQVVYYETIVQATSLAKARTEAQREIDDEEEHNFSEVDNGPFELEDEYQSWEPESHWDEHPDHGVEFWRHEVANDDTRQSYVEWVNTMIQAEGGE